MDYDMLNDFVENALKYADDISIKYNCLKELEINGINDARKTSICNELKNAILSEKDFYSKYSFGDDEIDYMIRVVATNFNIDIDVSLEDLIHNANIFLAGYRVIFKLDDMINNEIDFDDYDINEQEFYNHVKYQKNLMKNYYLVIENFILEYLEKEDDFKNKIMFIKYLLPFVNSYVEDKFIKDFIFDKSLYLDHKMYGDFSNITDSFQIYYTILHFKDIFVNEINNLLEISDDSYDKFEEFICVSEIIIKSIAVFFENDYIDYLIDDLSKFIDNNPISFFDKNIIISHILLLPDILKKDKSNYLYLSLKPPKQL